MKNQKKTVISILSALIILLLFSIGLNFYEEQTNIYKNQNINLRKQIGEINQNITELKNKTNNLQNRSKYVLKDVSYDNVIDFLKLDKTNETVYDEVFFNCAHFSSTVNNNAEEQGIRCGYVEITLNGDAPHAIIAFNTTDKGIMFFEPQNDKPVDLQIGMDYWKDCVENGTYNGPGYKIISYVIYW